MPNKKVDRYQVYEEVVKLINGTEEKQIEISSSDLADRFGVAAPTMDYHLGKLVDEGLLSIAPQRGKYNRKIYRVPSGAEERVKESQKEQKVYEGFTPEGMEKLDDLLHKYKHDSLEQQQLPLEEEDDEPVFMEETPEPVQEEKPKPLVVKELTLDERIEQFLKNANQVHDAEVLLKHEDREILSVMNETITQTTVYLKDLSEQLSTIQNKQLIQALIDERNRTSQQIERIERELKEERQRADKTVEQYKIEPNRVRFMHQLIVSTVDNYVNQPNQAIALGRHDFREKVSKEVLDLVRYVLHMEE